MKVAFYRAPGKPLCVEEAPYPKPGHGQAVIKVCRCGICSTDLIMTTPEVNGYPVNTVIGHEIAGEVLELGPGIEKLKVGDHVTGLAVQHGCGKCKECVEGVPHWCSGGGGLGNFGGYAQYSMVQEMFAQRLPKTVSMNDGALVEPMACALHGVAMAKMEPGSRVLVIGAGPIGLGAIFWARHMGAGKVAAMARSDRRKNMALSMGADAFISGKHEDPARAVNEALGGMPDVIFECSGAPGTIAEAINYIRPRGTIVVVGFCTAPDTVYPAAALFKEIVVRFSMMYNTRDYEVVADVLGKGIVDPSVMITSTVGLDALPAKFEALRGPNDDCKVLVDPWL